MTESTVFRFPTEDFRAMPIPFLGRSGNRPKSATFFVRAKDLPPDLEDWMEVNPRIPKMNKRRSLTGIVARAMKRTLQEEPENFVMKNQGMYLLAEGVRFEKVSGGQGIVSVSLADKALHGLVNGGHTFLSIREVAESEDCPEDWDAYVRVHVIEIDSRDSDAIPEIAEGLNRSMQVDDPSLENLKGTFDSIRESLDRKSGNDQIAYKQGDSGEIDVQQVLTFIAMLDLKRFPDRKNHPNVLFGHPKAALKAFKEDLEGDKVFDRIIPHLHEILVLTDNIQKKIAPSFGRYKAKNTKRNNRSGSKANKKRPAYFAGGKIEGEVALGWLYPVLAAFRANISHKAWEEGRFEWLMDPTELLEATHEEMVRIVQQEHKDNNSKPAEVGRKEAAYRGCYGVVVLELAQRGLLQPLAS
jgi:hypothetical protein